MADHSARSAGVWIAVTVLVGAYAAWLTMQTDRLAEQAAAAQARERQLVEQLQRVATAVGSDERSRAPDALVAELLRRPDLIPLAPQVGGTYYFLEDSVRVLSDRYVYATVEDGHVRGHVLLEVTGDDGTPSFRTLHAYVD